MKAIPYSHQHITKKDIRAMVKVLTSDWLTQGPKVREFESALCKYTGAKHAIVVSSGTAALHLATLAAGIRQKDEAITSPITFVASANCILYCGGIPVFVDIQNDTINIDPKEIRKKITRKTKVIIPVHFAGHPCDLDEIRHIAKKHNLLVIEDAAHALGAEYKGSKIGSCKYSDMTVFSFHPVKSITTGEGGAILTNSKSIYEKILLFRNHGITKDRTKMKQCEGPWYYEMHELGFNYRLTDMQCALGISQLKKLNGFIKRRRSIADFYNNKFKNNPYFDIPTEKEYARSSYHLYPIKIKEDHKGRKRQAFESMRKMRINVQLHYIPVYLQPYYRKLGFKKGICQNAESFYQGDINIPIFPSLKLSQAKYVANKVIKIFDKLSKHE
ncbi:UDP-4-amino-4,6-dideoxy-N-acetyl-beta-L-altrosamine transaminase [Candidatus Omnitrophota bacterium]